MRFARWGRRSLGVVAAVAVVTALIGLFRGALLVPNLSPIYLLPVILFAVSWGWWPALASALLAFLAYNFFFVEPVHTFTIHDPQEWVQLLVFLLVAAVTSNLAARERARREEARQRAEEATLLYSVSRALGARPLDEALAEVAELLLAALDLRGCAILLTDESGRVEPRVKVGQLDGRVVQASADWLLSGPRDQTGLQSGRRWTGSIERFRHRWIAVRRPHLRGESAGHGVPLRVGKRLVGWLRLAASPEGLRPHASRLLATIAEQLAAAIERERLQQAANDAELLRRTDELRSALLSSVSHDLRTPLAAIKASAGSLLQQDVDWSEADRQAFAEAIDREADRLDRLVRNLLDMSRIEGGALQPRLDWYDLAELVREVTARLSPALAAHRLQLELADDLQPVRIDYLMIDQVLTNLIENAAKYTPPGTQITVRLGQAEEGLRLCVVDHGPGIPADVAGRIFDKFQRAGAGGGPPGSGLGLAVSRGFIEAHGGRLEVDSTPGVGASFCFTLPIDVQRGTSDVGRGALDAKQRSASVRRPASDVPGAPQR